MERIVLAHGSGGRLHHELINKEFRSRLSNPRLDQMSDAAILELPGGNRVAFSTDSFVIDPLFFPGGDIGCLAVYGTANDLSVSGATPRYLSAGFIIEEGFPIADLRRIIDSMHRAAVEIGLEVVTGDTKVVGRGQADKLFINTAGIGLIPAGLNLSPSQIRPGDQIIVSGLIGEHGLAILAQREGLGFTTPVQSDCGSVHRLAQALCQIDPAGVRCMRDPTRGGLATTLNELAQQGAVCFGIKEERIPVSAAVRGACSMLGMDPLYLANEGKLMAIVAPSKLPEMLKALQALPEGQDAAVIGEVREAPSGLVLLETALGTERVLGMLEGELLPRIC